MAKGISSGTLPTNNATIDGSETLSNKTLDSSNIFSGSVENPSRLDAKKDTFAALQTYAASAQNGELVYATDVKKFYVITDGVLEETGGGGGAGDVDVLEVITAFDTSSGLTTPASGINGGIFRLTHDAASTEFAQRDLSLDDKWRDKVLELLMDIKSTAASGNFKVIVTDETNAKTLLDEIITPQDADSKTSKKRFTFSTTPAAGDSDIATIRVRFEALAEAGSPTSDFDDVVVGLAFTEVVETTVIEQEENVFSAKIVAGAIQSQSSPWLASVSVDGSNVYTLTFKSGFFSEAPSMTATALFADNTSERGMRFRSITSTQAQLVCILDDLVNTTADFQVVAQRQGSDYKDLTRRVESEKSTFHEILAANEEQITEWTPFTPVFSPGFGAVSNVDMRYRRVGDSLEIKGNFTTGSTDGTNAYFHLPSGLSIDSAKIPTATTQYEISGQYIRGGLSGANYRGSTLTAYTPSDLDKVYFSYTDNIAQDSLGISPTSTIFNSGEIASVSCKVPIDGWEIKPLYTVFEAAPESKVKIPSSELRMTGGETKGTGNVITFATTDSLRGDALTFNSSDGTIFTVQKDGKLDVNASIALNSTGSVAILKNNVTVNFAADDVVSGGCNVSWSGSVKVGDEIKITCDTTIFSAPTINQVNLYHQEQRVQVAVSNVTPQYEDADSMVRLHTNNGHGSTNTKIKRFSTLVDNIGSAIDYVPSDTDGDKFVIKEDGFYAISYGDAFSGASEIGISLNSTELNTNIRAITSDDILASSQTAGADFSETVTWSGKLSEGDVVRAHTAGTAGSGAGITTAIFTIAKVGVPSIAEVDITPFADVNRRVVESARYSVPAGYGSTNNKIPHYTNELKNTFSDIGVIQNDLVEGWSFTATKDCTVNASYTHNVDSGGADYYAGWTLNSTQLSTIVYQVTDGSIVTHEYYRDNAVNASTSVTVPVMLEMKAGDVLRPHTDGVAIGTAASLCYLTITAEADSTSTLYSLANAENEFSARIANNGVASIVSESYNFIDSVNWVSTGIVDITFKSGFFSIPPSIVGILDDNVTNAAARALEVNSITLNGCRIETKYSTSVDSGFFDYDFSLHVSRQGADRKDLQRSIVQLNDFPKVNRTISQEINLVQATNTMLDLSNDLRFDPNNISINGDSILLVEDDSSNARTKFTASRKCRISISASAVVNAGSLLDIQVNDVIIVRGTQSDNNNHFVTASGPAILEKGDYITVSTSNPLASSASAVYLQITAQAQELERVTNVDAFENHFAAEIGQGTINSQSYPFIDSVVDGGSVATINLKPGFFSVPPTAVVTSQSGTIVNYIVSSSTSTITVTARNSNTGAAINISWPFNIHVSRQEDDYKGLTDLVMAIPESKTKYQTKFLNSSVSSTDTDNADLRFSNLEIGKTYRISGQLSAVLGTSSDAYMIIEQGGTAIARSGLQAIGDQAGATIYSFERIFVCTNSTLVFNMQVLGATAFINGGSGAQGTFATLEELPNHESTSQWT